MKYIPGAIIAVGFALAYLAIGDLDYGAGGFRWAQMIIGGIMMIGGCIARLCTAKEKAASRAATRTGSKR